MAVRNQYDDDDQQIAKYIEDMNDFVGKVSPVVGPTLAQRIWDSGIETLETLFSTRDDILLETQGLGAGSLRKIRDWQKDVLAGDEADEKVAEGEEWDLFLAEAGPALGEALLRRLWAHGYTTPEDLFFSSDESLLEVPGVGVECLVKIRALMRKLWGGRPSASSLESGYPVNGDETDDAIATMHLNPEVACVSNYIPSVDLLAERFLKNLPGPPSVAEVEKAIRAAEYFVGRVRESKVVIRFDEEFLLDDPRWGDQRLVTITRDAVTGEFILRVDE